jgi:hypothetical protein
MPVSTRRLLLSLVARRQKPGSGSQAEFIRSRTAALKWPDLSPILGNIPWCVVGAVATRLYMPERMTVDLDAAVAAASSGAARERMHAAGFVWKGDLSIGGSSWQSPAGENVDLLELRDAWAEAAILGAQDNRDAQGLPTIELEYLVLMKLDASRLQDVADLGRMLCQAAEAQLADVRAVVARHRPADLEDLEALISSGRWELGEGRNARSTEP